MTDGIGNNIRHGLGFNAVSDENQRYIDKEQLKKYDEKDFSKFEPLFNYFDKIDNKKFANDGKIDLRTFASFDAYSMLMEDGETNLSPRGYYEVFDAFDSSGINEESVAKICKETGTTRETVIDFIKSLFKIQQQNAGE